MTLRPYQEKAIEAVEAEFSKGIGSTLIVLATGCGKTIVFSNLAAREVMRGGRVLILAHRGELLEQAVDKLYRATGIRAGMEKAEITADVDCDDMPYTVVVGSVQSMSRPNRLKRFGHNEFSLIVIDECHHALTSTYRAIIQHFPKAKLLGVTATPDRGDLQPLSEVFQTVSFEYTIVEAIKDGFLSPVRAQTIPLRIDLTGVAKQAGDYQVAGLGTALDPYLHQICREIKQRCADRKTIVFTPLIATSLKMLDIFREEGLTDVREVNGESDCRGEILDWFSKAPKGCVLLNSMLLTEGYDEPSVDCIVVLRATKVRALYCLDEQTEVLTFDGWRKDVSVGEYVWAFNKETERAEPVPVLASIRRPVGEDESFYHLESPSLDIRVTDKHRMIYDNKFKLGWKVKTAEEIAAMKDGCRIPISAGSTCDDFILSDDEIRFIAWVLTDGSINKSNHAIIITQNENQPYCEEIQSCIDGCNFKYGRHVVEHGSQFNASSKKVIWTISHGMPRGTMKDRTGWARLEPFISKDFSYALNNLSERQFDLFLEVCNHANGSKQKSDYGWTKRSYSISTGNKTFADNLQACAVTHGWKCNVSSLTNTNGNPIYLIHCKKKNYAVAGSLRDGRPTWVKESGSGEMCWCVQNRLGTLITRRNGKVAIVGNCQMVGRGTRLSPETGKQNLLLLDFLWLTAQHDLCRPACIVSENPNVVKLITEKQEKACAKAEEPTEIDITPELADEAESEFTKKTHDNLAKRLEAQAKKKGQLVDPLEYAANIGAIDLKAAIPATLAESDRPTMEQVDALEKLGFACPPSQSAAEKLLTAYNDRVDKGLASPKQIRFLKSKGFKNVENWTFAQGDKLIKRFIVNHWRIPHGINPETYIP